MRHTELHRSAVPGRNGDRKVCIRVVIVRVLHRIVRPTVENVTQDLGDVRALGHGRAPKDTDDDGDVLRSGERPLTHRRQAKSCRGMEEAWSGLETHRFVELDGDLRSGRHVCICFWLNDVDALGKDGSCECRNAEKPDEEREHDTQAELDKRREGGREGKEVF